MRGLADEFLGVGRQISGLVSEISQLEDEIAELREELEGIQDDRAYGRTVDLVREQELENKIEEKEKDLEALRQVEAATGARLNEIQQAIKFIVDEEPLKYIAIDDSSEPGGDQ